MCNNFGALSSYLQTPAALPPRRTTESLAAACPPIQRVSLAHHPPRPHRPAPHHSLVGSSWLAAGSQRPRAACPPRSRSLFHAAMRDARPPPPHPCHQRSRCRRRRPASRGHTLAQPTNPAAVDPFLHFRRWGAPADEAPLTVLPQAAAAGSAMPCRLRGRRSAAARDRACHIGGAQGQQLRASAGHLVGGQVGRIRGAPNPGADRGGSFFAHSIGNNGQVKVAQCSFHARHKFSR
jgi:hypothetical protein